MARHGLSLTQVMLLQSFYSILSLVLEIPTGYFADVHGRKNTLLIASTTGLIGVCIYSIAQGFSQFLIAETFFALSFSFTSGTASALIYDTLQDLKRENEYKKIWGNAIFYGMLALAVSNTIGGFLGEINLRYTIYAAIPFFALAIPVVLSMQEQKKHKIIFEEGYTKELIKILKNTILKNKKLKWIITYSGVVYAFNQAALWLYQPYFELSGLNIAYFGLVFASFQIIAAISSKYAHKIEKKLGEKYSLILLIFLVSISYLLMSNFVYLFSFSFCFIQQFVRGFKKIIISDYINKLTSSNIRATTISAESFIGKLIYAIIIPIFGWIADAYTLTQALLIIGISALASGTITILMFFKKTNTN